MRLGLSCLPLVGWAAWQNPASATVVTSGELLRQNPQLTPGVATRDQDIASNPDGLAAEAGGDDSQALRFPLRALRFDGELTVSERQRVDAFVAPLIGQPVTLARLQNLRGELTTLLYHGGDALVSVRLPPQTIEDGVVRFQLVRGHIEDVRVDNGSDVRDKWLQAMLARGAGGPSSLRAIERNVRRVLEVPGVGAAHPLLSVGAQPGGTRVTVAVEADAPYYGNVMVDNAGSPHVGERRVGVLAGLRNPFGHGDRLEAWLMSTPPALQPPEQRGGSTRLSRLSYDSLVGPGATRMGAMVSQVAYRLGGEFAGLGKGSARAGSVYAQYPLVRDGARSVDVAASVEHRDFIDRRFDGLLESRRAGSHAALRASGQSLGTLGGWGNAVAYAVTLGYGDLEQREVDRTIDAHPGPRRRRTFAKIEPSLSLTQAVADHLLLSLQLRGQRTSGRVDASERLGLSGPAGVRAYDQSTAAVDDGAIVTLGVAARVPGAPGTVVNAFYDAARGRNRAEGGMPAASVTLQGYGAGIECSWKGLRLQASYARPTGRLAPEMPRGQFWFSVGKAF